MAECPQPHYFHYDCWNRYIHAEETRPGRRQFLRVPCPVCRHPQMSEADVMPPVQAAAAADDANVPETKTKTKTKTEPFSADDPANLRGVDASGLTAEERESLRQVTLALEEYVQGRKDVFRGDVDMASCPVISGVVFPQTPADKRPLAFSCSGSRRPLLIGMAMLLQLSEH